LPISFLKYAEVCSPRYWSQRLTPQRESSTAPDRAAKEMRVFELCVAGWLLATAEAAIDKDEIKSLPGWEGALPSRHWSGYLEVPGAKGGVDGVGSKFYHYWFVESEGNPKTDPVALWLNGGPGSSSLIGFLTENGPFETNDASLTENTTVTPKLFHRETGWQKAASYIYLESPAGVGFSYCDYENCTNSDTSTAIDNHRVLKKFFAGFPEFAKNDFFITGESYAGVYCPTLAEQIM
jgi:cathepsin A (carboxypeptidase C)